MKGTKISTTYSSRPVPSDLGMQRRIYTELFILGDMERIRRYNELCILADKACWVASKNPILYRKLKVLFQNIISNKDGYWNGEDGSKNTINQDAQTSEGTAAVVGDPITLSTEGALSKTKKVDFKRASPRPPYRRAKEFNKRSIHLCSLCHQPGHNIRKCKQNPKNQ